MYLAPTWNLFILILFTVIVAYSLIIGAGKTGKIIVSSYIGILAADGLGNLLYTFFNNPNRVFSLITIQTADQALVALKILLFIALIIALTLKGGFESSIDPKGSKLWIFAVNIVLGVLSAGLIVSAILVYFSGGSFLPSVGFTPTDLVKSIYEQSPVARLMIDQSSMWFSLPGLALILRSILG
ncbi:MAG: hypothetical protein A2V81_02190 [Candidatus Abawacabacteria bacterium RBG_16_42_10]|uniref:CvpA family protein n=1 Tax=Candidatus Abawacabacteria bacterium RBG_16_42_10 TaxID=1817814 RepID=A0A1F4XKT4_9BACT|nr:MAG: hypothetical protein A2V81_02190 [Candidatus Abawacabacteria bacterium RBG_16_42_10]